jgi:threonine dehydrogenase-like Zn-dependent dehydrogenase
MGNKMRALTIQKPHDLVMMEVEKPKNKNGHAMIKLETCGICGSDVTAYGGYNPTQKYPIQGIGHEGVGIIVEIEENEKGLKVGDRVALEPYVPDFTCPMCKVGRYNNCTNLKVRGVHIDGMMVDYIVHPLPLIHKIPADIDAVQAACVEPLSIALHGVARARVRAGEKVVIFGAGTIGIMTALSCLSYGAEPIIVDIIKSRLDFAGKVGIPHTFDSSNGGIVQSLQMENCRMQ